MNWETVGTVAGGVGGGLSVVIPAFIAWAKSRKNKVESDKKWQNNIATKLDKVSETMDSVSKTMKEHDEKLKKHDDGINNRSNVCVLNHKLIENQFGQMNKSINDYTELIREAIAPVRAMQSQMNRIEGEVMHVKELLMEKLINVNEKVETAHKRIDAVEEHCSK